MTNTDELRMQAEQARAEYRRGMITREEAKKRIDPFKVAFEAKSKELAKKYGIRAQKFSLTAYLR
ncbi:MAG: hypothetical protein IKO87_04760 [Kiritimatiellae bacterium]|nr:hypothetical protein [Kiritimatiellia bacterium]